ncbi:spondin-1-like [Mizuhopecten yessoensis]|uniref:Spondin-1 n=1 Tax=Mizuhopecten yessoensis TaxID=6573 RepID=A0A210PGX6_MIZYE|nr:spondin-1-like [Mizuhopecten yessoensis]OWF35738.1 Spondin-1 [Mizuhopecten yessoensis]
MSISRGIYFHLPGIWSIVLITLVLTCVCGTPCDPRDCIVSDWGHWTECSQSCGEDGVAERTRRVLQEAACGGICDVNVTETDECNRWCCAQDCRYSAWSAWSNYLCSRECDNTTQRAHRKKTRDIIATEKCGGYCSQVVHERQCGNLCCYRDCVESWWMEWGPCVGQCEQKGVQSRRKRITQEAACGGIPCSESSEERQCYVGCCPVHCEVGEWGEWSVCNSTCGNGHLYRSRFVQPADCGGRSCPDPTELQIYECSNYVDIDCVVSIK